jgi:hypothetical protein
MSNRSAAHATTFVIDASESARLRSGFATRKLRRDTLWRSPTLERRTIQVLVGVAILANLLWIIGLDRVMQRITTEQAMRGPIEVSIITPPEEFEIPPEPQPEPVEFRRRASAIRIEPPRTKVTPPPLNTDTSAQTQARIGSAGEPELNLFNADGSLRLPKATTRIGPQPPANPQEAGKARWAEIQNRGENPLDCRRTRFAGAFKRDESLGDEVSRKYLKWIGLADGAGIAERAGEKARRAADGCDPAG